MGVKDGVYYHVFEMTCFYGTYTYIDICPIFVLKSWEQSFKIHKYLWLIHVDVWQKPSQYCKAIILQSQLINFVKNQNALSYFHDLYQVFLAS